MSSLKIMIYTESTHTVYLFVDSDFMLVIILQDLIIWLVAMDMSRVVNVNLGALQIQTDLVDQLGALRATILTFVSSGFT